jgi:RimJ/RimL family protein N-acetyltransferase
MGVNVRLREIRDDDLAVLFENQRDPEAAAMVGFEPRDHDGFLEHRARVAANPENLTWAIETDDGELAGDACCYPDDGRLEVGYWIGRKYWGKGIATAALTALLAEVRARPLHAHVSTQNPGSQRVLEKCGFVLEETLPGEYLLRLDE